MKYTILMGILVSILYIQFSSASSVISINNGGDAVAELGSDRNIEGFFFGAITISVSSQSVRDGRLFPTPSDGRLNQYFLIIFLLVAVAVAIVVIDRRRTKNKKKPTFKQNFIKTI